MKIERKVNRTFIFGVFLNWKYKIDKPTHQITEIWGKAIIKKVHSWFTSLLLFWEIKYTQSDMSMRILTVKILAKTIGFILLLIECKNLGVIVQLTSK